MKKASELAKTDSDLVRLGAFEQIALKAQQPAVGYYEYTGISKIAAYAKSNISGRTIVVNVPYHEFIEVQADSEEMLKGEESAAKKIQKLDEFTRIFTDGMNEMATGAAQINNAVQEVNNITQQNKRSIENLTDEVGKVKI